MLEIQLHCLRCEGERCNEVRFQIACCSVRPSGFFQTCSLLLTCTTGNSQPVNEHVDYQLNKQVLHQITCRGDVQTLSSLHPSTPSSVLLCSNCCTGWFCRRRLLPLTGIEDKRRQPAFRALRLPQIFLLSAFEIRLPPSADYRPPAITRRGVRDPC